MSHSTPPLNLSPRHSLMEIKSYSVGTYKWLCPFVELALIFIKIGNYFLIPLLDVANACIHSLYQKQEDYCRSLHVSRYTGSVVSGGHRISFCSSRI